MPDLFDRVKGLFHNDDDDDVDACSPGRWIGAFIDDDGNERRVDETRDDEAWLLVLFASVLGDDEKIRRKAEEWRELFPEGAS
jgi:hypothetical protein